MAEPGKGGGASAESVACNNCGTLLSNDEGSPCQYRIQCCQCSDYSLCVDCYASGVETHSHKAAHTMYTRMNMQQPFMDGWAVDEELLLLDAIELIGIGHWELIRHHIDRQHTVRSVRACYEHYTRLYGPGGPFAADTMASLADIDPRPMETITEMYGREMDWSEEAQGVPVPVEPPIHATPDEVPFDPTSPMTWGRYAEISPEMVPTEHVTGPTSAQVATKSPSPTPSGGEASVHGYMPIRGEFTVEYDDSAEDGIVDMVFDAENDTLCSANVKVISLNLFVERLKIREEKKAIVRDGGLLEREALANMQRMLRNGGRDLLVPVDKITPFFRYSDEDHPFMDLVGGLAKESELRTEIARLQDWRVHGLTKKSEGAAFDAEMARRTKARPRKGRPQTIYGRPLKEEKKK